MKIRKIYKLYIAFFMMLFVAMTTISCDSNEQDEDVLPARYGEFGKNEAISLAENYPERFAGTAQEKEAANWIVQELEKMGYQPEIQSFSAEQDGASVESQNIILRIEGLGFEETSSDDEKVEVVIEKDQITPNQKKLLFTAHYDTPIKTQQVETSQPSRGDGIHNNAAAVGSLLTLAQQMKTSPPGYNVEIIFFGASELKHAGAMAYLSQLSSEEKNHIEVVYNLERIYAGDKVYAHAGMNSILSANEKSYAKRHKLYELTDVYYNNLLLTNNNFALYTNQNTFSVPSPMTGETAIFREWTTTQGDQTPFDEEDIPVVFIESYEYDVDNYDELGKESSDPNFIVNNGVIDRSNLDSVLVLNPYFQAAELEQEETVFGGTQGTVQEDSKFDEDGNISLEAIRENKNIDRLERRINNIAFLLLESSRYAGVDYQLKE